MLNSPPRIKGGGSSVSSGGSKSDQRDDSNKSTMNANRVKVPSQQAKQQTLNPQTRQLVDEANRNSSEYHNYTRATTPPCTKHCYPRSTPGGSCKCTRRRVVEPVQENRNKNVLKPEPSVVEFRRGKKR